jgi:hypothetical protein
VPRLLQCAALLPILIGASFAQAPTTTRLKVVAGIVQSNGEVRYLPRVDVRVTSRQFAEAERKATEQYQSVLGEQARLRDAKLRELVQQRQAELQRAKGSFEVELAEALKSVAFQPTQAVPSCLSYNRILREAKQCDNYSLTGTEKLYPTPQLRELFANPLLTGDVQPGRYRPELAPGKINLFYVLKNVPASVYEQIPEFSNEFQKARQKALSQLGKNTTADVGGATVGIFVNELNKAQSSTNEYEFMGKSKFQKFGDVRPQYFGLVIDSIGAAAAAAYKGAEDAVLSRYIQEKDQINTKYDAEQRDVDAEYTTQAADLANTRETTIRHLQQKFPPLAIGKTSLQGELTVPLRMRSGVVYAEDTTTDRHYRWVVPVEIRSPLQVVELDESNAIKSTVETAVTSAKQNVFPKTAQLSETERAEYSLRYGHELSKQWKLRSLLGSATPLSEDLQLSDTPLGFCFHFGASSTVVFNTLRVSDNEIAARFFKELVSPYLQEVPGALAKSGGSEAFECASISVTGSAKSFAEEYAVGDYFTLTYVFKLADVESFATQKIDAQQLLDRGHITHDKVGRIAVKLVGQ